MQNELAYSIGIFLTSVIENFIYSIYHRPVSALSLPPHKNMYLFILGCLIILPSLIRPLLVFTFLKRICPAGQISFGKNFTRKYLTEQLKQVYISPTLRVTQFSYFSLDIQLIYLQHQGYFPYK